MTTDMENCNKDNASRTQSSLLEIAEAKLIFGKDTTFI